jgi:hypothetical protein
LPRRARNHPYTDADGVRAVELKRAEATADEFRNNGGGQNQEGEQHRAVVGEYITPKSERTVRT